MSERVSTVIGDIFRWIIALSVLPVLLWLIFAFFMYPFEWLLSKSTNWGLFFHIAFWVMIGGVIVSITTALGGAISALAMFLVRQSSVYVFVVFLALLGLVGFCVYGAWSSNVQFSWEIYPYKIFNRLTFTLLIFNVLQIPLLMYGAGQE